MAGEKGGFYMESYMKKLAFLLLISGTLFVIGCSENPNPANPNPTGMAVKIFKTPTCNCCGVYVSYLKKQGFETETVQLQDMASVKQDYSIPSSMQSCHTTIIGDYFVEGHVPVEAIEKLLQEKPDIAGIALPGMPSGSPGMIGAKLETFVIYAVKKDGTIEEFMKI